jgi:hypothetical protein
MSPPMRINLALSTALAACLVTAPAPAADWLYLTYPAIP